MSDTVANALISIKNAELLGKKHCEIKPASKLIGEILKILQKEELVGSFEFLDDGKSGVYRVQLLGKINNCGVIKPRHSVKNSEIIVWEKRFLPSRTLGIIILSTNQGIMTHKAAKQLKVGGKLLAFIY